MSPPTPVIIGSVTLSTAAAVTAASIALPPRSSTASPAAVASGGPGFSQAGRSRRDGGGGIGDPFARQCRRAAVDRLEQAGPARMQVGARGDPQASHETRAQVGENIPVEVVGDDDFEAAG